MTSYHLSLDLILNNYECEIQSDLSHINLVLKFLSSRISSLPSLAACSRTSNSLTSPASPATEVFKSSWQPAAGQPTLQLHQLFNDDTSKATSSASGPASLHSYIITSFTGGLQQELQLFNLTSFSRYSSFQTLLSAFSKTSNSSTSPASSVRAQQDTSRTSSSGLDQVQGVLLCRDWRSR